MLTSQFIHSFLRGPKHQGFDLALILNEAGIDPMVIDDPDAQFDGKQLQRLFDALMHQLDDIYMGFVKEHCKPM